MRQRRRRCLNRERALNGRGKPASDRRPASLSPAALLREAADPVTCRSAVPSVRRLKTVCLTEGLALVFGATKILTTLCEAPSREYDVPVAANALGPPTPPASLRRLKFHWIASSCRPRTVTCHSADASSDHPPKVDDYEYRRGWCRARSTCPAAAPGRTSGRPPHPQRGRSSLLLP